MRMPDTKKGYQHEIAHGLRYPRTPFRLLGGGHNFYAGRTGVAIAQLLLCWTCITWFWALIEILTVTKDGEGKDFA